MLWLERVDVLAGFVWLFLVLVVSGSIEVGRLVGGFRLLCWLVSGRCADLNPAVRVTMIVVGAGLVAGWRPSGWWLHPVVKGLECCLVGWVASMVGIPIQW